MNDHLLSLVSEADCGAIQTTHDLLNRRAFQEAESAARKLLDSTAALASTRDRLIRLEAAGLLIDIGAEGKIESAVRLGLATLENERDILAESVELSSYEYCLGNAQMALYEIKRGSESDLPALEETETLTKAKNHFWRASKTLRVSECDFRLRVQTNLANALFLSGRVVEALDQLDQTLRQDPTFAYARHHRGKSLLGLAQMAGGPSPNLLYQAMVDFDVAARDSDFPLGARTESERLGQTVRFHLEQLRYSRQDFEREAAEIADEANSQSIYRRWCLDQRLALSEHALYCNCVGARRDDLMITVPSLALAGDLVPRMELYMNRLKAEFTHARWLYFASGPSETAQWATYLPEVTFAELFEGECISMQSEMLRASFRQCFGILDKIAVALAELLQIAECTETLYFESFWRPGGKKANNHPRWQALNQLRMMSLLSLYSAADDLNQKNGEWQDFKKWRNEIEHRLLLLLQSTPASDMFGAIKQGFQLTTVAEADFRDRTLHLLRLVRGAIFAFAFCARQALGAVDMADRQLLPITLAHK